MTYDNSSLFVDAFAFIFRCIRDDSLPKCTVLYAIPSFTFYSANRNVSLRIICLRYILTRKGNKNVTLWTEKNGGWKINRRNLDDLSRTMGLGTVYITFCLDGFASIFPAPNLTLIIAFPEKKKFYFDVIRTYIHIETMVTVLIKSRQT